MSTVRYSVGYTRNMGDFESLRLDIAVEDSPRGEENTSQAYNRVKDFAEGKLMDEVDKLERAIVAMRENIRDEARERQIRKAAEKEEQANK